MKNVFSLLGIVVALNCLVLAFIIMRSASSRLHKVWLVNNVSIAIWGFGCFLAGLSFDRSQALISWKIAHVGGLMISVFFYHLVYILCGLKKRLMLALAYIQVAVVQILNIATPFFLSGIKTEYGIYYPQISGPVYPVAFSVWLFFALLGGYELLRFYRKQSGPKRTQSLYLIVGYTLGFIGGCIVLAPIYNVRIVYPAGNLMIIIYTIMVTYAIFRHQLLDIEVIIKKTLVFAGLLASIFAILVLPTLLIQEYILRSAGLPARLFGLTLSGIIIIVSLRRIENFLINITDKYLFQKKYDYKELLKTFTAEVLTVINLDRLLNLTVEKLTDIVKVNSCAVLLLDAEEQKFNTVASRNVLDAQMALGRPDGIVTFLEQTHGYLLKKELIEKKIYIPDTIREIIDKLNTELIIPMVLHNEMMGILTLGKKKSDEDYTQDDLDILLPLARTLAIAVSNAKLFDELGKTQAEAAQKEKMAVIGTLSAGINHEICNPLGIARGQCEAFLLNLKDGLYKDKTQDELLAKAKDIMAKVIKETDRATAITKRLSGFAKPAKGEAEIINIDKELDDVIGLVGYELKLEKIELEKHIDEGLPNILVDKKQLQEILFNLIRNAGQAIGEKGKITISAKENVKRVFIDIKDTGSGIPEDKLKELFNPFFTTKDPGKGTGLGLFIVRQIVEKNGGRIYLKETKVGEGTTFTIEFPAAARQEARA